jgi:flavorubredoxin
MAATDRTTRTDVMKAIVVYESLWGNTAAIARAIADGLGPEARALHTDEAVAAEITSADLIVAGAPVMAFRLPTDAIRASVATDGDAPSVADLAHPSMRAWLGSLPTGTGRAAVFETRISWSPGGSTGAISKSLQRAGYRLVGRPVKFVVKGKYGPLRDGELERARKWGAELAQAIEATSA